MALREPRETSRKKKPKKPHRGLRVAAILLSIVLFCEFLYCFVVFTDIKPIKDLREAFISTAMETMSHQWLATAFFPEYMVNNVVQRQQLSIYESATHVSDSSDRVTAPTGTDSNGDPQPTEPPSSTTEDPTMTDEDRFYELFWELSRISFEDYVEEHPDVLANGWDNIYINEAGLDDSGTSIYTSMGEQVLAIDAKNKLLLVRVQGTGYLGVLAIGKDPSQLRCEASAGIGSYGQEISDLVANNGGVIGMTASGFIDVDSQGNLGNGNGGILAGYTMCKGTEYGTHYQLYGYKRIELTQDNKMYIVNSAEPVGSDVTDAAEFTPALVVDGNLYTADFESYNAINPRACIGQSERGEILMLVIEGRLVGRSIGTDVETCANILMRHEAYTALNLDGGTSAIMWFDGEFITKCSNSRITSRPLPNAWVYGGYDEE